MANCKTGLDYYAVSADRYQDPRIKRLIKCFSCKGLAVYDYILCVTFRGEGCFLRWDENTVLDVAETLMVNENFIQEIVKYCGVVGLFHKELLACGIITSATMQKQYIEMCTRNRRKHIVIPEEYRLCPLPKSNYRKDNVRKSTTRPRLTEHKEQLPLVPNQQQLPPKPATQDSASLLDHEIENLMSDESWIDQLQCIHHMPSGDIKTKLESFRSQCIADGKETGHSSLRDAKQHFNAWLRVVNAKKNTENGTNYTRKDDRRKGILIRARESNPYESFF